MEFLIIFLVIGILLFVSLKVGAYCRKLMFRPLASSSASSTPGIKRQHLALPVILFISTGFAYLIWKGWLNYSHTHCWTFYGRKHADSYICGAAALPTGVIVTLVFGVVIIGYVVYFILRKPSK